MSSDLVQTLSFTLAQVSSLSRIHHPPTQTIRTLLHQWLCSDASALQSLASRFLSLLACNQQLADTNTLDPDRDFLLCPPPPPFSRACGGMSEFMEDEWRQQLLHSDSGIEQPGGQEMESPAQSSRHLPTAGDDKSGPTQDVSKDPPAGGSLQELPSFMTIGASMVECPRSPGAGSTGSAIIDTLLLEGPKDEELV